MNIKIFYDAPQEIEWFKSLDERLKDIHSEKILSRGKNSPDIINELILYDRPDIIILKDNKPVLVLEKTEEVPSGHNVGQRIARLVRAVELNIPIIKFFPFLAKKHGKYASKCYVRPNIFFAFKKMSEFHHIPVLALNWICDKEGELIRNGEEDKEIGLLIKKFLDNGFSLKNISLVAEIEQKMLKEYEERTGSSIHYRKLAPAVNIINSNELFKKLKLRKNDLVKIPKRNESFIYTIEMTPEKCRREDPYTGNQFIYDYFYCRNGPTIEDREKNFVLNFPLINKSTWFSANPENHNRKSYLWYILADFIIFKDGVAVRGVDYDKPLKEPEIYLLAKIALENNGWKIIGGEPPDGTDKIPRIEIHDPENLTKGSKGSKKIDLIAIKDKKLLLLELKTFFDITDITKLDKITSNENWMEALKEAIEAKTKINIAEYNQIIKALGISEYHDFPEDYLLLVFSKRNFEDHIGLKSKISSEEFSEKQL